MKYLDFEVALSAQTDGARLVHVLRAPGGEARQPINFDLSDEELRQKLTGVEQTLRYQEHLTLAQKRARLDAVKAFGGRLFDALFNDDLKSIYDQSRLLAKQREQGLRLQLRIDDPLLAAVPWELLYDPRFDEFLATSRQVSIVRYVALPRPARLLATSPPLNILGIVANPHVPGLVPLDAAAEKERVEAALKPLTTQGLAHLTWLEKANWRALLRAMSGGPWHALHYVGHSDFDAELDEGYLSLVDDKGGEDRFTADKLAILLADHGSLRLVLLNSCQGARIGQDIYSGVATTLVRRGVPTVIGMQYDVSDEAALEFAQTFYETLAENLPIETAVAEARKAISLAINESVEWGTAVFYTHAPDSLLFAPPTATIQAAQPETLPPPAVSRTDVDAGAIVNAWVEALTQTPTMQNRETRQAAIAELPPDIRHSLNEQAPTLIAQLRDLVKTCQNQSNGLSSLVQAIRIFEDNSLAVQRLESLL